MRQIVHLERISTGCVPCTHPTDPMSKPAPLSLILVSCLAVAILGCNEGPTAGPSSDAPSEDAASDSTSGTDGAEEAGLADLLPDASAEAGTPDTPTSDNVAEDVEHDGPSSQDLAVDGDGPADTAGDRSLTDGLDDEPHAAGDADAAAVDLAIDETDGDGSDSGSAWTPPHPTWEEACGWRRWPEGCACDHMELLNCCVREDLFECFSDEWFYTHDASCWAPEYEDIPGCPPPPCSETAPFPCECDPEKPRTCCFVDEGVATVFECRDDILQWDSKEELGDRGRCDHPRWDSLQPLPACPQP
jgi:hypothetical protein